MLRVGRIPYLNCEPFFSHLRGVDLVPLNPRALGQAMAAGAPDAGPLSLVDFLSLEGNVAPLPCGIATSGPARSVLLFSDRPLSELGGAVIGVTEETSTSVQILKLLLSLKYEVIPRHWVGPDNPCDAVLLIGDRAIRALKLGPPFSHVTDLGSEWGRWTGGSPGLPPSPPGDGTPASPKTRWSPISGDSPITSGPKRRRQSPSSAGSGNSWRTSGAERDRRKGRRGQAPHARGRAPAPDRSSPAGTGSAGPGGQVPPPP